MGEEDFGRNSSVMLLALLAGNGASREGTLNT